MTDTMEKPKVYPVELDLTPNDDDGEILTFYKQTMSTIRDIDEKLDAGLDSTGKRKLTNELVEATKGKWEPVVTELVPQMQGMSEQDLAGVFYGLIREFTSKFKEPIDKWLQEQVEAQPKTEDTLSEDEKKELAETRSELATSAKQIVVMATTFGLCSETEPWALPKRRGAVGKRGKRALTLYSWTVDGEGFVKDEDNVKGVSQAAGFEKAGDFTKALRAADIDTKNPPNEFTVTLNGKSVSGTRLVTNEDTVSTEPDDVDDEDDEDEDEDEE